MRTRLSDGHSTATARANRNRDLAFAARAGYPNATCIAAAVPRPFETTGPTTEVVLIVARAGRCASADAYPVARYLLPRGLMHAPPRVQPVGPTGCRLVAATAAVFPRPTSARCPPGRSPRWRRCRRRASDPIPAVRARVRRHVSHYQITMHDNRFGRHVRAGISASASGHQHRVQHRIEQAQTVVGRTGQRLDRVFRVGHQPDHPTAGRADAGNVAQ
ncbi:hypothetical protein LAUMK13_04666 [Mycobacterium innocens]|uniref:Uncharacterized protein n=1 Tax=Mycobacterium innocens TaxID=2341083 RepID=A0A498QFU9_9MYCO|nr:hypothetical protein LAUMK13_04666 [Mycobacterium innocens]